MTESLKPFLIKAASFCAYQERTSLEVKRKLNDWGLDDDQAEDVLSELIVQKYLDESRFAASFARGKFRHKHWGRLKIRQELKMRGLAHDLIQKGLAEIDDDEYLEVLRDLIEKKAKTLKGDQPIVRKQKLVRYALSKGFESDLIWQFIS